MPKYTIGFVYVLSNSAMPGIVKVGRTAKLAEDRAKELHDTGVPVPFDVEFRAATSHPKAVEQEAHTILASCRVTAKREFFRTSPSSAIDAVKEALLNAASIAAWQSDEPHEVKRGDRIALTLEAGDLFVVLSYPDFRDLVARRAQPIDFWQAHSGGDVLELMGAAHPGHVAGFSDGDPGGETDPVPYLDRAQKVPNGVINGRERLVAGERLLWFRPMVGGECCRVVLFEIGDHCQVIGWTWDLKFSPDGHPLLLNMPTYDTLPACVARGARAALRMAVPRTWAPRAPDPSDGWAPLADSPQPPEYWLSQLRKPQRGRGRR
jgi:hypothetical protein